jgi:hypothetical protein
MIFEMGPVNCALDKLITGKSWGGKAPARACINLTAAVCRGDVAWEEIFKNHAGSGLL